MRPSGRAGLLVSSFEAFAEYQRHQAWTWEHQALARTRVVAGPAGLSERYRTLRRAILSVECDPEGLRREVREMRERMRAELDTSTTDSFDLKPVSYTHLDVYKRQPRTRRWIRQARRRNPYPLGCVGRDWRAGSRWR